MSSRVKTWADRIKILVEAHGGLEQAAVLIGVRSLTVYRWMTNAFEPSLLARRRIEELEKKQ